MATFEDIRDSIRSVANIRGIPGSIGLRTPTEEPIRYKDQELDVGTAWGQDKSFEIFATGIANYLDSIGVGLMKEKLNELIGEYNQLRSDYIAAGFSTTSDSVNQIP